MVATKRRMKGKKIIRKEDKMGSRKRKLSTWIHGKWFLKPLYEVERLS